MNCMRTQKNSDGIRPRGILKKVLVSVLLAGCGFGLGLLCKLPGRASPPSESDMKEWAEAMTMQYARMRLDGTCFANAVAGYWFLESQKSGNYFVLSLWDGVELHVEETAVAKNGEVIRTVWFPARPESSQTAVDMCHAYNDSMIGHALDLAREGDNETALRICRQIRKLCPDMGSYPWDDMEKDLVAGRTDLPYPYTCRNVFPPLLARRLFEFRALVEAETATPGQADGVPESPSFGQSAEANGKRPGDEPTRTP